MCQREKKTLRSHSLMALSERMKTPPSLWSTALLPSADAPTLSWPVVGTAVWTLLLILFWLAEGHFLCREERCRGGSVSRSRLSGFGQPPASNLALSCFTCRLCVSSPTLCVFLTVTSSPPLDLLLPVRFAALPRQCSPPIGSTGPSFPALFWRTVTTQLPDISL